ncbi:ABC transporter substrate-binding protein [Streptomyces camponoticapitis]|uniref:ABC transporter substrate-binding protein n=1 Tax=Streptomyces camponoticapitis TaxID=1616125 RepID=A0ABQ2DWA9_9ACTN|nr:ABC transporter substrate-binding protein [Streptomyces camponoticapitis]GGJ75715.1 ABC transporter substrate-binding protein [Streptomyces camponoticapitis]
MFFDISLPRGRRRVRPVGAAAIALGLAAVTGCSSDSGAGDDTVKIGLVASLSGTYEAVGTELRKGFELYLATHDNKLGGRKAELVVADEGDGPPTAVPAATKLIKKDKVDALTGLVGGGSVNAVLPLINQAKIPLLGSNARPPVKDMKYVWTTSFLSDEPGKAIAPYIKEKVDGPVYAIGPDYQGGYDELRGFTEEFKKVGGKLANPDGETKWTPFPKTTNFMPYFADIAKTDAKAVYCFYAGKAAIDFAKQYAQSDVADLPLYTAFVTEGSVLQAQGDAAKDVYSVLNYAADLDNEANRKFAADWTAKHDTQPTTFAMASYDAAAVLDLAIADAGEKGEVTPETINKAIGGLGQIDSPRGAWEFGDKAHSPVQQWYLRQVRKDGDQLANVMVQDLATLGS